MDETSHDYNQIRIGMSVVSNNRSRFVIGFRMSSRTVFGMPILENGTVTFRGKADNNWRKLTSYVLLYHPYSYGK